MDALPPEILLLIFEKLHCTDLKTVKLTNKRNYVVATSIIRTQTKRYIFYLKEILYRSGKIINKLLNLNSKNIFIYNILENIISNKSLSNLNRLTISMMSIGFFF